MVYKYLILDSKGRPVVHCTSLDSLSAPMWRLEMSEQDVECVMTHKNICLVGTADNCPAAEGRIVRSKGEMVWVESVRALNEELRENLRIPVRFETFLYPVTGTWKGRRTAISYDLSCGGVAFYCAQPLEAGEIAELVVTVTSQPLVLRVKILRRLPSAEPIPLYAARFVDLVREEESMVREAVFSIQLRSPSSP